MVAVLHNLHSHSVDVLEPSEVVVVIVVEGLSRHVVGLDDGEVETAREQDSGSLNAA